MFLKIDFRKFILGFTFIQKCGLILKLKMKTIVYNIVLLFLNGVLYVHTIAINELIFSNLYLVNIIKHAYDTIW